MHSHDFSVIFRQCRNHEGTVRSIMENDKEIEFKFHARKLEYIASFLKPATAGSDISPFSTKNLPKCDYPIPEEDLAKYNAILDSMDNKDSAEIPSSW